jgi:hypothetical protein
MLQCKAPDREWQSTGDAVVVRRAFKTRADRKSFHTRRTVKKSFVEKGASCHCSGAVRADAQSSLGRSIACVRDDPRDSSPTRDVRRDGWSQKQRARIAPRPLSAVFANSCR